MCWEAEYEIFELSEGAAAPVVKQLLELPGEVAVGWSGYLNSLLTTLGLGLPASLAAAPLNVVDGSLVYTGGLINLPAVAIIAATSSPALRALPSISSVTPSRRP